MIKTCTATGNKAVQVFCMVLHMSAVPGYERYPYPGKKKFMVKIDKLTEL